ncbi:Gfo/Idh/MocA family oxidoreductase [Coleofasciculus sp. FACHB-712]|uniref:Gfo/Idh/MocA family protein n=1 Tax=Coleofasciculus sp. FACHB-712 TaxID=2692789 RepID=UPI0016871101|nr:Gfo/Idh/MocA family oxidoreductase [Coleofasciculus sp. FACHB-712]MBD1944115.1 Gfo/Idh/MocA family oxidoreductase [Coleofasciculus sp. FACHB-712]
MKTGIAVLGAGRWGVHLVRNFLEHPQSRLVAVLDPKQERLEALRERFKLDDSVLLTTEWSQVQQMPEVEAVAIATPATTHYTLIADALRQGYHVLSEKPLTLDPSESIELCRLAEQQHRQLFVDHTYLFHPAVERGKTAIQSGILGDLRYGYATRTHLGPVRQDVDALWDLAIHDINIFNNWLQATPTQVQANGTVFLHQEAGMKDGVNSDTPPSPQILHPLRDLVWATLTYPSGFQAFIHLCWLNPDKQRRLCVVGSEGTLIFDELQAEAPLSIQHGRFENTSAGPYTPANQSREVLSIEPGEPLGRVCDRFLSCIHQNQSSEISSGWVGAQLVQILRCLSESLQQGGLTVTVPLSVKN